MEVMFKDDGEGMSEEELNDLFTPFVTTKTKGMGLGLVITRRIIKDHSGRIKITSEPGKGSEVKITIPINNK
jgi:signal transduction histidine kinase